MALIISCTQVLDQAAMAAWVSRFLARRAQPGVEVAEDRQVRFQWAPHSTDRFRNPERTCLVRAIAEAQRQGRTHQSHWEFRRQPRPPAS